MECPPSDRSRDESPEVSGHPWIREQLPSAGAAAAMARILHLQALLDAGGGIRTPDTRIMIGPGGVRLAKVSQVYSGCLQLSSVGFDLSGTNSGPTYGVDPYKARRDRRLHADLLVAVLSEPGDSRQADEQPGYPYAVPFGVGFWVKVAKRLRFFAIGTWHAGC